MKRIHLFEFTDLPWYPQTFRRIQTDYLQFASTLGSGHKNLIPLFKKAMQHAETTEILDLCSGGTGPWIRLQEEFKQVGMDVKIKLTDKFPNPESVQRWKESSRPRIEYLCESIDAMKVPSHLKGMRTMFEGFHHFKPEQAFLILRDAVESRAAIGIFEASLKPPLGFLILLLSPLVTLLSYLFVTPFIKPRTFARFFWTYLIPIVPLATCWDGIVSLLRVCSMQELRELAQPFETQNYTWEIGQASTGTPIFVFMYLVGYPIEKMKGR